MTVSSSTIADEGMQQSSGRDAMRVLNNDEEHDDLGEPNPGWRRHGSPSLGSPVSVGKSSSTSKQGSWTM